MAMIFVRNGRNGFVMSIRIHRSSQKTRKGTTRNSAEEQIILIFPIRNPETLAILLMREGEFIR